MLFKTVALLLSTTSAVTLSGRQTLTGSKVCEQIASKVTGSVFFPYALSFNFLSDTAHYMSSSSQTPMCVVEVANAEDVSNVLKIVGSTRTPFAVKSGGHASNPGFSSTPGVFISQVKLKQINLSEDKMTVEIGLGNVWTDVYAALDGTGVNVVGGRVVGPGTGGFTLGGGYSWLANQYGLTCDTVKSFNLVLPNGTITVADATKPDLFFALKGGLNRFGIVTSIVFKTVTQTKMVYGGLQVFGPKAVPALIAATEAFQNNNTDPKAQVILTINGGIAPGAILLSFYDGPNRPSAFDPYNGIKPTIDSLKTSSYAKFSTGNRGAFATLSTTGLTIGFMNAVHNESIFYGTLALANSGLLLSYDVEPFLDYGKYATDSAYPHSKSQLPLNLYYSWSSPLKDNYWRGVMQQSINYLTEIAKKEGIYDENLATYPNYALATSTGAQLYGVENAAKLRQIQSKYDPNGVMQLAGGFTF